VSLGIGYGSSAGSYAVCKTAPMNVATTLGILGEAITNALNGMKEVAQAVTTEVVSVVSGGSSGSDDCFPETAVLATPAGPKVTSFGMVAPGVERSGLMGGCVIPGPGRRASGKCASVTRCWPCLALAAYSTTPSWLSGTRTTVGWGPRGALPSLTQCLLAPGPRALPYTQLRLEGRQHQSFVASPGHFIPTFASPDDPWSRAVMKPAREVQPGDYVATAFPNQTAAGNVTQPRRPGPHR
jgi:hypothetical protein